MRQIVFIGPPGSGKGTQAVLVAAHLKIKYLNFGEELRRENKSDTPQSKMIKKRMDAGKLLPDKIINNFFEQKVKAVNHYVLDGYPRTLNQASHFDKSQKNYIVFYLAVPEKDIIERISLRRSCPSCGATFHHTFKPEKNKGKCDNCDEILIRRPDDAPSAVKIRLREYHHKTQPIIDFFRQKGTLIEIDGHASINAVTKTIFDKLKD